ncbi:AAA family ATPase [Fonticella tunisiensis]|uniref:Nuclease SbcCD subunit C n=1 Tax=Fonticella tunisiensis TaxID=1096341 RepID=A0A4R7KQY9_9CLOT|nr:AAA family ATPase [Fonticella tunisiensis]TDT61546.1 AAA domain-containing protein [Fonticella tunisiensis]
MKYIKSIELINFQSHKNSFISFENGLNVISGPSDNGKSAIIRALKWVLYNEPKGTDFIRQGESSCKVTLILSDNTTIVRERTKSKNLYKIINSEGKESVFEGFGNEIPEEILKAHGILRMYIDASSAQSINLSEQLEGPFLISQPGSIKAKAIGRLVGVHIVDEALKELNRDISNLQSDEKRIYKNIDELNDKLKEYEYLKDRKKEIERKERIIMDLVNKNERIKKLKDLKDQYETLRNEEKETLIMLKKLKSIEKAENAVSLLESQVKRIGMLYDLNARYGMVIQDIDYQKTILHKTRFIDQGTLKLLNGINMISHYNKLLDYHRKITQYNRELENIYGVLNKLATLDKANIITNEIEIYTKKFNNLVELKDEMTALSDRITKGEVYLKKFEQMEKAMNSFSESVSMTEKYKKMYEMYQKYIAIVHDEKITIKNIKTCNESIKEDINEYMALLKKIGKCPVCMSPIEEHTIEQIINEFKGDEVYEKL